MVTQTIAINSNHRWVNRSLPQRVSFVNGRIEVEKDMAEEEIGLELSERTASVVLHDD